MSGYGDDAGFTAYMTAAGYTVPTGSIPAARQRGSLYIDSTYGLRFPGVPTGGVDQDRAWPRTYATDWYGNAIDPDTVPVRVINASYEAALVELAKPGSLSVVTSTGKTVAKLKAGSVEIDYAASAADVTGLYPLGNVTPLSSIIEGLLAPLLVPALLPGVLIV